MSEGGDNSGGAARPVVVGVSRRFGVGHILVAMVLFAFLFSFLQFIEASFSGYLWCSAFCVAIALGQVFLYQGRYPRRASCLVGSRFSFVMVAVQGGRFLFSGTMNRLANGTFYYDSMAEETLFTLLQIFLATVFGYVFGYMIGAMSAGIFLLVDRKQDREPQAGESADGPIPPTGRWWLDWMAWSPVKWFWQNRQRPVRNAILLAFVAAVPFAVGIPILWGGEYQQHYLIGAAIAAPVIGAALAGLLLAGWRMSLVLCGLALAGVAFPLYELTTVWAWKQLDTEWSWGSLTVCLGPLIALLAAGAYGWLRWLLTRPARSRDFRRLDLACTGSLVVLFCISSVAAWSIANSPREQALRQLDDAGASICMESAFRVRSVGCSGDGWQSGMANCISKIRELKAITLGDVDLSDQDLQTLATLHDLEEISLYSCRIPEHALEPLSPLVNLRGLVVDRVELEDDDLEVLGHFRKLETVCIVKTGVSDASLRYLKQLTRLKSLKVYEADVTGSGLDHLEQLGNLETLNLFCPNLDDEGLAKLPPMPSLTWLGLENTKITGKGLLRVTRHVPLRMLDLYGCDLDDSDVEVLRDQPIRGLFLENTRVSDETWAELNAAGRKAYDERQGVTETE